MNQGTVIVNGAALEENYVPSEYRDRLSSARQVIPEDHFYVLGDHRSSSNDSRAWGPLHRRHIYGKAVFVYWPLERFGPVR